MSFKEILKTTNKSNIKVNMEMIDYQVDPSFINEASEAIEEICKIAMPGNVNFIKNKSLESVVKLEKILTNRFGVNTIVGHNDGELAFCLISGSNMVYNENDFFDYHAMNKKLQYLKNTDPKKYEEIVNGDPNDIDPSVRYDYFKWWREEANKSFYAMLDKMKKDNITIDLKKGRFSNAPKNMKFYASMDWYRLSKIYKLNSKQILAVLLHEIGHCFTHAEYSYKVFNNVQILSDVIREEYSKRGKTPVETIKIFYNKTKLEESKSNSKNMAELTVKAYRDIIRGSSIGIYSNHPTTDSEQQADEFASRFGLGAELSQALKRLGVDDWADRSLNPYYAGIIFLPFVAIFTIEAAILTPALILAPAIMSALVLLPLMTMIGLGMWTKGNTVTYDDAYRRYKRIRNTTVRRLNSINDSKIKDEILKQIDIIDKIQKRIEQDTKDSFFRRFAEAILGNTKAYDEVAVNEILEDLTANELIIASAKWNK